MNIFEHLDMLLTEAVSSSKVKESDIPIHPEMETKEQGEMAAAEKVLKLFQKLKMGSGGHDSVNDGRPEIPDDLIDPMLKEPPKSKDKTFDKNKLAGWDEKPEDKIKKEVDVENDEEEDDEFDDFDYRQNSFGDEEDDEDNETPDSGDDDRSEDEKLRDSIEDAIDSLDDDKDGGGNGSNGSQGGEEDDDSGANWGDEEDGDGQEGGSEGGSEGGQQGGQQNGQQGGDEGSEGEQQGGQQNSQQNGQQGAHKGSGSGETQSARKKRLEGLKKSLDSKGMGEFNEKMEEMKTSMDDGGEDDGAVGGQIETPSDEAFRKEMQQAGLNNKSIDKMIKEKNTDTSTDYSDEELEELRKQVIDGLEKQCRKNGGSSLATSIAKNASKRKISDEEWEKILEMFLSQKSEHKGESTHANDGYKFGHKNHLWRGAVLPSQSAPSKGAIQNIYCFVDFSGSVDQDLVFTFLGKVIDLCVKLEYTNVVVYGVGERITEPRILDDEALEHGSKLAVSKTWEYISQQNPGGGTTNFRATAKEMNKIKRDEDDAIFLVFGDAFWSDSSLGVKWLRYDIDDINYLDDICMMIYYNTLNSEVRESVGVLVDIVGIKNIITSKAASIHE
jgi:hypothetical protein